MLNLTQPSRPAGSSDDRPVLPSDTYHMKIIDAKLEDDRFAKPEKDGSLPQKIALTFEMAELTPQQQRAAKKVDQDWSTVRIWHRFNPYYGPVKEGGPSKLKEFLDNLAEWGLLDLNLEAFDPAVLVGIELKCLVVKYAKTMGENVGKPGNKIASFAQLEVETEPF